VSEYSRDDERELLAAHECLLAATATLTRAQSRADALRVIDHAIREGLGFGRVQVLTRGAATAGVVEGHVVALGDLTGVLLVDEPDARELTLATRLRALRSFADAAGATLSAVARLEVSRAQARHDPLTRLPNRAAVVEHLGLAIARARRHDRQLAVLFLDLDRFKEVNDVHGHSTGDAVLRAVAGRLAENVRPQDAVGRFGGDEFVIVCEELAGGPVAGRAIVERLASALEAPIEALGRSVQIGASIGLALGDGHSSSTQLLRDADAAMYAAKDLRTATQSRQALERTPAPEGSSRRSRPSGRAASG
jgi:diguanylate cyclase (GGDEF)-like protein